MLMAISTQLNCYATNSTIQVITQSDTIVLVMYPLSDGSTEQNLCAQLNSLSFSATVIFGAVSYTQAQAQTFSINNKLSITFSCNDACAAALAASSASYSFYFSQGNVVVTDTISTFQIEKYNRKNCISNPTISFNPVSQVIEIQGTANGCEIPLMPTKHVSLILSAYPDIIIYKSISLAGISTLQQLIDILVIDCINDYTDTEQRTCQRLIEQFTSQSNYAELTLNFPGLIPDNSSTSTYSRDSPFSIYTEISTMSNFFVNNFDCFTSQQLIMFADTIRIDIPINASRVHCAQPIQQFIGSYDQSRIVIQIQDNPDFRQSTIVQFTFSNAIFDFNTAFLYFPCEDELEGSEKCASKLAIARKMTSWTSFIERKFYKNDNVVQSFQTLSTARLAKFDYNAIVNISKTKLCVSIGAWITYKSDIQVSLQLIAGFPKFAIQGHSTILDLKGQISYPLNFNVQPYCMELDLSADQIQAYETIKNSQDISGIFHFMGAQCSAVLIYFADENKYTNYVGITSGISAIIAVIWFVFALYRELR
ncbi:Conserved_hypothetical protein [Hexamita inflata]|uniref:Transmembrane protein n=1 Tax=Hexamita inflata TaxID=28002 RepID=A0AA86QEU4_9EUKA|nr:Conserved hypothetical protein [Hexamita inflata]